MKLHKFAKDLGYKCNEDFYKAFPTEESYFKYMKSNGQANVEQNQTLPPDRSVDNQYRNVKEEPRVVPKSKEGDSYKKGGCHECEKAKMQLGGYSSPFESQAPQYQTEIHGIGWGTIPTENWAVANSNIGMAQGWQGFGNDQNLMQSQGSQPVYSNIKGFQGNHSGAAIGSENYSIDKLRSEEMKYGGIHIKPENKGKFTAWAKAHGMSVQEAASHVMANKEKYSSTIVKRANFAKNAKKFKHEDGGEIIFPFEMQMGGVPDFDGDIDMMKGGGHFQYQKGGQYEVSEQEYNRLKFLGYKIKDI